MRQLIVQTQRQIYRGRCILMGLDRQGRAVFGIASLPQDPAGWARQAMAGDLGRCRGAFCGVRIPQGNPYPLAVFVFADAVAKWLRGLSLDRDILLNLRSGEMSRT